MSPAHCLMCNAAIADSDVLYSPDGDTLCPQCYEVAKTHREIEQATDLSDVTLSGGIGGDDGTPPLSRAEADSLHRLVDSVAPSPAHLHPATVACATCTRVIPAAEACYGSSGLQVCPTCAAAARRRTQRQRVALGIGVLIVVAAQVILYFFVW